MVLWSTTVHRCKEQEKGQEYSEPVRKSQATTPCWGQAKGVGNQDQERQETKPRAKDAGSLSEAGSTPTQQRETQHGHL